MTAHLELYKCEICGNIVQVMKAGFGELVCCGKPMTSIKAHLPAEELKEKHVPVYAEENKIQIGSVIHPMTKEHHIEFIQVVSEDNSHVETKFLKPETAPEMITGENPKPQNVYEYCNLHGLWRN